MSTMGQPDTPSAGPDFGLAETLLPYVLLGLCLGLSVLLNPQPGSSWIPVCVLTGLVAGWILWIPTLHPAWMSQPRRLGIFITVLIVLLAPLVLRDGWFGFFLISGYAYAFELPWPWRQAGVAGMAVLAATAQTDGVRRDTASGVAVLLAAIALNGFALCSLSWFLRTSLLESDRRKLAVDELSEANRKLEATLAENAGLHEQLLAQAREAGVLDERQRMAREIHDTLAQGLTGIVTQLQAAEQASDDPAGWRRHFAAATRLARESLSEARRSVDALRPETLETARLSEALADVAARWSALQEVPVQVTTTGTARPIHPDAEFALLRAAQEALANVARHARATRVGVTLSFMEHEVVLDVRDDGGGFDLAGMGSARDDGSGFGLVAMRQRIAALSGTMQVESEPGGGTAISACVPTVPALASP
jgi:signal transduction histidine kinase